MINRLTEKMGGQDFGSTMEGAKESALDMAASARERLSQGQAFVREFTLREPAKALGIAAGIGVLLGWLIKRRR
jgi:ElaB/YqjD/DUF883 family membrane-anchored ribosome-binding protein